MIKRYLIKYTGALPFLFWFLSNAYKTKEVECDMRSASSSRFDFKSEVYAGEGLKINIFLSYTIRYAIALLFLVLSFPSYEYNLEIYIFSLAIGGGAAIGIAIKNKNISAAGIATALGIFLFGFLYFQSFREGGMLLLYSPKFFIFFFILIRMYYDIKENMGKKLYFLPEQRILFYV